MKLLSCHISHFGKISDFQYDFNDGFNPILKENGWGKTTFSVFIKAMFYGLEYSPNTKKKLLERNHYMPWDGSVCGGNIVFSVKDRIYRIERTFGKTDKDDTFKLFDCVTGLESDDYSANIGEELFKVDRDSFEKSVYIPQMALGTGMTDSLNAKMGNLASAKDDISNFDAALKTVKDARNEYVRNSKVNPGKLNAVKAEINKCKEDMEKLPAIMEGFESASCLIEEKQENLENLQAMKASLVEQIQNQSKKEQELGAYKTYQDNLKEEEANLASIDAFFKFGVPGKDELAILEQTDTDLSVHERALEHMQLEQKKSTRVFAKPFEERVPDDTEFAMWNKMATNLSELRAKAEHARLSDDSKKQLTELRFFFDKKVPTEDELINIEKKTTQIISLDARINHENERLIGLRAQDEASKKQNEHKGISLGYLIGIVLLIGFIAGAAIFINYDDTGLGEMVRNIAAVAAVADIAIMALAKKQSSANKHRQSVEFADTLASVEKEYQELCQQKAELEQECSEFLSSFLLTRADTMQENVYEIRRKLDRYEHLVEEEAAASEASVGTLDELADLQLELYTKIQPYATAYGINLYDMGEEFDFLNQLKKDADRYITYLEEQEEMVRHEASIKTMSHDMTEVLSKFPLSENLSRTEKIREIVNMAGKREAAVERVNQLKANIAEFEKKYDVNTEVESVDELQKRQVLLDEQIVDLNRQLMQDKEGIVKASEEIERLGDIAEQIDRLETKEAEYKEKAETLALTADFLQKARESFLSKYMQPLQDGLHKYLSLIDSPEGTQSGYAISDFELDMDLNIRLDYSGNSKSAEYLSQGYQDLVALCSRLALVDVLYSDEKPILMLDDPFTNLDDKKIKESLKLLEEIAEDRQTIYFTCHDSRL